MESLQPRLIAKHKETFLSQLTGSSSRNSAGAESLLGALARSRVQEEPTEQSGWWWCPWVWPGKGPLFPLCGHLSSGEDEPPDAAGPFLGPSAGATTAASSFPPPHSRIFAEMSPYCVPGPGGVRVREKLNGVGARAPAGLLRGRGRTRTQPTTGGGRGRGVGGLGGWSGRGRLRRGAPRVRPGSGSGRLGVCDHRREVIFWQGCMGKGEPVQ